MEEIGDLIVSFVEVVQVGELLVLFWLESVEGLEQVLGDLFGVDCVLIEGQDLLFLCFES